MECLKLIRVVHEGVGYKVPCGKCAFCLSNKRSQWMFRIHHEMKVQEYPGYFLTLTYDEKHVKRVGKRLSLRFRDIQLFLKRVRKDKYYCKYVCVGEYGGVTHRPHYHMLLWSSAPVEKLESYWKMGSIHFGTLTMQSAMYTLKYIIQPKQKQEEGIEKTRAQFSKGLGLGYLSNAVYNYHTANYEAPVCVSVVDGRQVALPRYYRNKIFTKFQMAREGHRIKWESIKARRKIMRQFIAQGVKNWKEEYFKIRLDQCRAILKSTKYNQSL